MSSPKGFALLEVILASVIFFLFVGAFLGILLTGEASANEAGMRTQAVNFAQEGIEAVRSMRDQNYASLDNGAYGLGIEGGVWALTGSSDVFGPYTRTITVADGEANEKIVTVEVDWDEDHGRTGVVSVSTSFTNWHELLPLPEANTVTILATDAAASEDGSTGEFTFTRTGDTTNPLTVFFTVSGTATEGDDFNLSSSGSVEIPAGESTAVITLTPVDDADAENTETATVSADANDAYTVGIPSSADVLITDNDLPVVTIVATDASATESPGNPGVFRISRTGPTDSILVVAYSLSGTATNGLDYALLTGLATVGIGSSSVDVTLTPINDIFHEGTETATATISASILYTVGSPASADVSILDND